MMINIQITTNQDKKILKIIIKGHSYKKDNKTIEPLCATVSAVVLGTVNACGQIVVLKKVLIEKTNDQIVFINTKANEVVNTVLNTMLIQLETIILYFKKGIKIQYQQIKN